MKKLISVFLACLIVGTLISCQSAVPITGKTPEPYEEHIIYVTRTGQRYHYNPNCNGGTYYESTLEEAQARGLTPCKKCVPR